MPEGNNCSSYMQRVRTMLGININFINEITRSRCGIKFIIRGLFLMNLLVWFQEGMRQNKFARWWSDGQTTLLHKSNQNDDFFFPGLMHNGLPEKQGHQGA